MYINIVCVVHSSDKVQTNGFARSNRMFV